MCQFVAALLLKPVSCSCWKCALSPSSCLNCFTWFHHLCQKYVCTCQMLEIQLTVTDARSFFGVSRKWRTSPDSLKRRSVLRLAVFGGTITCLQTAHMKIFLSLCIKCVCLYQWCRRMFAYRAGRWDQITCSAVTLFLHLHLHTREPTKIRL